MYGRRANVMLHTLDVVVDRLGVESKQLEKIRQQVVPVGDIARKLLPRGR